jgi:hypothetical protein
VRTEFLTESTPSQLDLTADEAERLRTLGSRLASDRRWWGQADWDDEATARTVVSCVRRPNGLYNVSVSNCVGAVGLGDLQLVVRPKVPLDHFLYLLAASGDIPRMADSRTDLGSDVGFFDLVVMWFVTAAERLIRFDPIRDYERKQQDLTVARGTIRLAPTLRMCMTGRPRLRCESDDFGPDNSLNRVVREAARRVVTNPAVAGDVRRRARRVYARLDGVGALRSSDLRVATDARSLHYRDAHLLGRSLLLGSGPTLGGAGLPAWTFLVRTPERIEEGLRNALADAMSPAWDVRKAGRVLPGSHRRTVNPDLIFESDMGVNVGDIKYRRSDGQVSRSELSQVALFAAAYGARRASVVSFGSWDRGEVADVGLTSVRAFAWHLGLKPSLAASRLAHDLRQWMTDDVLDCNPR